MAGHATHVARQTGADNDASGDEGGAAGAKISTGAPRALRPSISSRSTTITTGRIRHHSIYTDDSCNRDL